jgi:hypothetical protein
VKAVSRAKPANRANRVATVRVGTNSMPARRQPLPKPAAIVRLAANAAKAAAASAARVKAHRKA